MRRGWNRSRLQCNKKAERYQYQYATDASFTNMNRKAKGPKTTPTRMTSYRSRQGFSSYENTETHVGDMVEVTHGVHKGMKGLVIAITNNDDANVRCCENNTHHLISFANLKIIKPTPYRRGRRVKKRK